MLNSLYNETAIKKSSADFTPEACYQAMKAHDARFDGRFFVGVSSTKIYCRPICRVKLPLFKNCSFHPSAAAAESAGFRPCLKCRPELAPGFAASEASTRLARTAARMIEDAVAGVGKFDDDVEAIAARVGVTDRHLRRIFQTEFGVSPVQYAQTQRLLLAKRLLTDTKLPVTDVAFASGFSSVRRMNALFSELRFRADAATQGSRRDATERSVLHIQFIVSTALRLGLDAFVFWQACDSWC
jgi:AraC family transcriptional regulator, regulatory protein of adaptative response / DNA-3-methyladenine glycosylase II